MDVATLSHSIACVLRSGRVSEHQAQVLQGALDGLHYCRYGILQCLSAVKAAIHVYFGPCSVGVYVKDFGTVITTDSLLTPGFFDLSLCPTRSSMAGCVVSQAKTFHDNVSVYRFGLLLQWSSQLPACFCILFLFYLAALLAAAMAAQRTLLGQSSAITSNLQSVCLSDFLLWYLRGMLLLLSTSLGLSRWEAVTVVHSHHGKCCKVAYIVPDRH